MATGTVEFRNGTTSTLPAANYSIRAVYGGTSNVNGSQSGTLSLRVRRP